MYRIKVLKAEPNNWYGPMIGLEFDIERVERNIHFLADTNHNRIILKDYKDKIGCYNTIGSIGVCVDHARRTITKEDPIPNLTVIYK